MQIKLLAFIIIRNIMNKQFGRIYKFRAMLLTVDRVNKMKTYGRFGISNELYK